MMMEDIEKLKDDKEFLDNLKLLKKEAIDSKNVAKMYQVLDAVILLDEADDSIDQLFSLILQTSFDKLSDKLSNQQLFNPQDENEFAMIRAIYEHGIEKYSNNDFKGAKEIFLVLYHISNIKELQKPLFVHIISTIKKIDFDTFFDKYVDSENLDTTSNLAYFIKDFSFDIDEFIKDNQMILNQALKELESLK